MNEDDALRSYLLRDVPRPLMDAAQARAKAEGKTLRQVVIELLDLYAGKMTPKLTPNQRLNRNSHAEEAARLRRAQAVLNRTKNRGNWPVKPDRGGPTE